MTTINDTLFIGKILHYYETLPSTNILALEMLAKQKSLGEGTVITTFSQSDGRGQMNNQWESEAHKNISLSVVLKPNFLPLESFFLLNQAISLGVYDFVRLFIKENVKIKWPNDIYVADKKIAGILIQNTIQYRAFQHSVIGIGINVNQAIFRSDAPNPTSIFLENGKEVSLWSAVDYLCKYLENRYLQLKSEQFDMLREDYHAELYRINEWHTYQADGVDFEGKIKAVADNGQLQIETMTGEKAFDFKTIKFR